MKILLLTVLSMAFVAILGMFYWMYKARKGELNLSTKSWHYKLKHWMWDFETYEGKNACPYYWGLVFSLLFLIPYIVVRYIITIVVYLYNLLPSFRSVKSSIKLPTIIPATKKEAYNQIYRKSKTWLTNILIAVAVLGLLSLITTGFVADWKIMLGFTIFFILVVLHVVLHENSTLFYEYYSKHWISIFEGIWGLAQLPFILLYNLVKIPFEFIFKVYTNRCPPIKWED